jgi:hypothetical protein
LKNESLIDLKNNIISQTGHKAHDRELLLVRNILLGVGGNGLFNDIIESWYEIDKTKKKAPPPVGTPSFSPVKPGNQLTAEPSYITAIGTLMEKQREGTNVR